VISDFVLIAFYFLLGFFDLVDFSSQLSAFLIYVLYGDFNSQLSAFCFTVSPLPQKSTIPLTDSRDDCEPGFANRPQPAKLNHDERLSNR
jgi:hypothetical protein